MSDDVDDKKEQEELEASDAQDVDQLLASRQKLDALFQEKFTKVVTVMFTDLKGSTALADKQGDIVSRLLVKQYLDYIVPAIKEHNGILIKTIGDGTLSYFESAQDAVRAAARLQKAIDAYIMENKPKTPILARAGLHTGRVIMEKNDIFGDVVNTASRFESNADPGGIAISEETYNALSDKSEIYCKYIKTIKLKGKEEPFKIYKAFWNPLELEMEKAKASAVPVQEVQQSVPLKKLIIFLSIALLLLLLLIQGSKIKHLLFPSDEKRSIQESTDVSLPSSIEQNTDSHK
jgi:adenylate cyclase